MADGAGIKAPDYTAAEREASPAPAILPLFSALVDIMVREELARQEAGREEAA